MPVTREVAKQFFARLQGPEGCNFRKEKSKKTGKLETVWTCKGGTNQDLSKALLKKMGVGTADADDLLSRCRDHGGHCDCEILFNAEKAVLRELTPAKKPRGRIVKIRMSREEFDHILAGLRLLQQGLSTASVPRGIMDIITNEGKNEPFSPRELDVLCEDLNLGVRDVK